MEGVTLQATEGRKGLEHEQELQTRAVVTPPGCRLQKGDLGRGPHLG